MSAASFLGIAGAIALNGYDGFLYSIGFLVAWLVALLLVAELLRNTGKFTMADVLSFRMRQRPVRDGGRRHHRRRLDLLPARPDGRCRRARRAAARRRAQAPAKNLDIAVVGVLMIFYVLVGGMKGTTWVQIVKAAAAHHRRRPDDRWCWPSSASTVSTCSAPRPSRAARARPSLDARQAVRRPITRR